MRGCTAKTALDPRVVLAFVDHHTDSRLAGVPARRRKTINGRPLGQGDEARILRRWRSGRFKSVTEPAVARVLGKFSLTIEDLELWGLATKNQPYIRKQGATPA